VKREKRVVVSQRQRAKHMSFHPPNPLPNNVTKPWALPMYKKKNSYAMHLGYSVPKKKAYTLCKEMAGRLAVGNEANVPLEKSRYRK
jgi:hypothetical protein